MLATHCGWRIGKPRAGWKAGDSVENPSRMPCPPPGLTPNSGRLKAAEGSIACPTIPYRGWYVLLKLFRVLVTVNDPSAFAETLI